MKHYSLFIILILGLVLRLINLNQSLWWDEAINVLYAKSNDFWWFVTSYPIGDFHPPGWFAILWIWGNLFGFSEISVRLPSVIFGIIAVYFTYLIGKELFNQKTGFLAALFLTVAPLHIYYSQEARMYSFAAFAAAFSMYGLIKLVTNKGYGLVLYILSTVFVFYSDYLAYFIIPAQVFWVLLYHQKFLKRFFVSLSLIAIFWAPWLLVLPQQLVGGQATAGLISGWKGVVGGGNLKDFFLLPLKIITGRITFGNNLLYLMFAILLVFPFVVSIIKLLKSRQDARLSLLWFWLILPPIIAILVSFWIPVFSYFRFIFLLPPFYLLTADGVGRFKSKFSKILIVWALFSGFIASSIYLLNPNFHREDWRGSVDFIGNQADKESVILLTYNEIPAPFIYYSGGQIDAFAGLDVIPVKTDQDLIQLENILQGKSKLFLFEYLVDITDPGRILEHKLKNLGFSEVGVYNFRGVGFIDLYTKSYE